VRGIDPGLILQGDVDVLEARQGFAELLGADGVAAVDADGEMLGDAPKEFGGQVVLVGVAGIGVVRQPLVGEGGEGCLIGDARIVNGEGDRKHPGAGDGMGVGGRAAQQRGQADGRGRRERTAFHGTWSWQE